MKQKTGKEMQKASQERKTAGIYETKEQEVCEVRETSAYQADEERKTIDDYYALPDDERVELIDGKFYAMSGPTVNHQAWLLELVMTMAQYIESKKGPCKVYMAPCDVRLDRDNYTMVQPDLMICCKRDQITYKRIEGAPDFVLEVMSPGSAYLDQHKKVQKYRDAGVREYWIVNPGKESITVYRFEEKAEPQHYTFDETVPVGIYNGDCRIDFAAMKEKLAYLYERQ